MPWIPPFRRHWSGGKGGAAGRCRIAVAGQGERPAGKCRRAQPSLTHFVKSANRAKNQHHGRTRCSASSANSRRRLSTSRRLFFGLGIEPSAQIANRFLAFGRAGGRIFSDSTFSPPEPPSPPWPPVGQNRDQLPPLFALVNCSAIADDHGRWFPNKELTPGAIAETLAAVLCVHGYAKAHRVWRDKAGTLAKYGIARDRASDDDLIPGQSWP
jgi:hypothetical protein